MKKSACLVLLIIGSEAFGQAPVTTPTDLVPPGYTVFKEIQGDLNKDHQPDYVYVIKATDKSQIEKDQYRGELDRNRRGLIIAFKNKDKFDLVLENRSCFSSENEDGGVYFAPELDVNISRGNLLISYFHGRYGYWAYNFRYQNTHFELIGYDRSENRGPIVEHFTSINFMTRKMLTKQNVDPYTESGDEKFKETWFKIHPKKTITLGEIDDFDNFGVENLIDVIK